MFKFRKSKRLISALLATFMLLSMMTFTATAVDKNSFMVSVGNDELSKINFDDIEFIDEIYETGEVLVYNGGGSSTMVAANSSSAATTDNSIMSTYNVGVNYFDSGNRTLTPNDAIDFYPFTAPTTRSYVVSFASANLNYWAILGIHDVATGNVTLTNIQRAANSNPTWFELPAANYCWVVLSGNNTYTNQTYRIIGNGWNPGNAIRNEWITTNLVEAAFLYSGGVIRVNGVIWNPPPTPQQIAQNFKASLPLTTPSASATPTYQRIFASPNNPPATTDIAARIWATQFSLDFGGLGTYSSTYVPSHTTPRQVIFIALKDINTNPSHNTFMGSYFVYGTHGQVLAREFFTGSNDNGFLILDRDTGVVIDWISGNNMFHILGWGQYTFSVTPGSAFTI
ncbi:MAG: hypothetical protein LBD23_08950 [Oscillospiraceae bacterium]|jgi:hypothetical protein|nr:hypothetical protein [Oscillospiraceae bacterium]